MDLGHNFVLAHGKCNASKGSILASEDHLGRWAERNRSYGGQIARECDRVRFTSDLGASVQIARWAYEQAFAAQSLTWVGGKRLVPLGAEWSIILIGAGPR